MKRVACALLVTGLALVGCSGSDEGGSVTEITDPTVVSASRDEVAAALVTDVIAPSYTNARIAVDALALAASDLCARPDEAEALAGAQHAWREASAAWAGTRAARFGPAMDRRTTSKIAFEADPEKIDELLAGSEPLTPESVAALGADQRTLGGIEVVLFGDAPIDPRRCDYLESATGLVADTSRELADAWSGDPELGTNEVIDGAVNGVVFALAEIADAQLGKASGDVSSEPEYAEVDAGPAHSALDAVLASLTGVEQLVSGGAEGAGLEVLIAEQSPDTAARLVTQLDEARTAIEAVPVPIAETSDTAPLSAAYEAVRLPLVTMRAEVASQLGVTLMLGDADGDS